MRSVLVGLCLAGALLAQDAAFERLRQEAARAKAAYEKEKIHHRSAELVAPLQQAFRDWIESQLPQRPVETEAELKRLASAMRAKLTSAGLNEEGAPPSPGEMVPGPGTGYVGLELQRLPTLPGALFVIAGATVECGSDQAVSMYRFGDRGRTRVFEDHPKSTWGFAAAAPDVSDADSLGRRLLLIHYTSAQCASTWMSMAYSVRRIAAGGEASELLLSGEHDFWLGNDGPEFILRPEELIVEFLDKSVDAGVHNRTNIQRYGLAQAVRRLDPVAFQPQDFAEEWLTRPWSEMESRSAAPAKPWHERLHAEYVAADYSGVAQCGANPGRWLIALDIARIGHKKLDDPLTAYFLVHDMGGYHYRMDAVAESIPAGCTGAESGAAMGNPSQTHPWLTAAELEALQ